MKTTPVIEKGIPIPPQRRGAIGNRRHARYPFRLMEVGDSILVDGDTKFANALVCMWKQGLPGTTWATRRVTPKQTRVWRTA